MQVIDLPPGFDLPYTAHAAPRACRDELAFANHGQEEVYVPLQRPRHA